MDLTTKASMEPTRIVLGAQPRLRCLRDQAANQSFERTRSAAASGFAGQQFWRAAQLQIR